LCFFVFLLLVVGLPPFTDLSNPTHLMLLALLKLAKLIDKDVKDVKDAAFVAEASLVYDGPADSEWAVPTIATFRTQAKFNAQLIGTGAFTTVWMAGPTCTLSLSFFFLCLHVST
jgi:hypothetical protein